MEFTSDETAALLDGGSGDEPIRHRAVEKLKRIGLEGYESVLGRNLKAVLIAQSLDKP
ncbi:MAG: hypothetical protein QME79_10235 [Bacillota bacterium]|nr:hypothetical protein [Bacillota bacterium]